MAYQKKIKYVPNPDLDIQEAMLEALVENGETPSNARRLVYYGVPMSLIRWGRYLNPRQLKEFLVPEGEELKQEEVVEDEYDLDLGI